MTPVKIEVLTLYSFAEVADRSLGLGFFFADVVGGCRQSVVNGIAWELMMVFKGVSDDDLCRMSFGGRQ